MGTIEGGKLGRSFSLQFMEHGLYWFDFVASTGEEVSLARDSEAKKTV